MSRTCIIFVALILPPHVATTQQTEPPRTDWGTPDFSGYWEYNTATPLERPTDVADKPVLTPAEEEAYMVGRYEAIRHERNLQLNADWWQPGTLTDGRTSLIVDPPDGRLPLRAASADQRVQTIGLRSRLRPADGPEDRERYERCIMGRTVPLLSQAPGKLAQIFQTPKYLAILHEQNSDLRIIPIASTSRSEHISENIRHWQGDSRAHWEGDTLVIEVTNFNGAWTLAGESKNVRYVERLSIGAMNIIDYEFTAHDTESFATPWTVTFPIARATGPLFENACHEGNHSMPLILNGARVQERAARARPDTP
tara:strand:- start:145 stop:1077 length:933 start_codon:yes stop_codon:yes gene_type:complete